MNPQDVFKTIIQLFNIQDKEKKILMKSIDFNDENIFDTLYELGYIYSQGKQNIDMKTLGRNHPNFSEIKQRIYETDVYLDKPFESVEGCEKCNKCGSTRTISYSKQLRSGDESAHVFIFCIECKSRYTINS